MRLIGPLPASVSMDAPASTSEFTLSGESRRHHGRDPTALAKADQIHASTEVIDRNNNFGKVVVDLKILHVLGRRLPVGQGNVANSIGQQSLNQALAFMIVGDHGCVTGMGSIDERGKSARLAIIAQHHGPQIKAYLVRSREGGSQLVMNFDFFLNEFEE